MAEPVLELDDIQGHVLFGFGGGFHRLLGLRFRPECIATARQNLPDFISQVATARLSQKWRLRRREAALAKNPRPKNNEPMIAMAFSAAGLEFFGAENRPKEALFNQPVSDIARELLDDFDLKTGLPVGWKFGDREESTPHILLIIGSDSKNSLTQWEADFRLKLEACTDIIYEDDGVRLPGDKEHFGFLDGVSQPAVRGLLEDGSFISHRAYATEHFLADRFAKPGRPLVWPGQFLFGYQTQRVDSLGPGPAMQPELRNGSLLVFRRLRQDVAKFQAEMAALAVRFTEAGIPVDAETAAAWCVGRWPDGTPLTLSPDRPDQSISGDRTRLNGFLFERRLDQTELVGFDGQAEIFPGAASDSNAYNCPFFAHIRKVNPRDQTVDQGTSGVTSRAQMLRRGVPYGPRWTGKEDEEDRGLLFLAYMTSVNEQFMRLSRLWANNRFAPPPGDGIDPIIGAFRHECKDLRPLTRRTGPGVKVPGKVEGRWVHATGSGVFFAPGIRMLHAIVAG